MNVHRLLALSMTAVVVAACSGGGEHAPAPKPAPSAAGVTPSLTKHAANGVLTLKFAPNYVRLKPANKTALHARKAAAGMRRPAFVDPSGGTELQIEVTNTSNTGAVTSYMAAINVPIVDSQSNTQSIPIYLAPGYDTLLVQETAGGDIQTNPGYLLAQGSTSAIVSEGSTNTPALTMQIVMSGVVATTDVSTFSSSSTLQTSSNFSTGDGGSYSTLCINNHTSVYFLPVDSFTGTYAYAENPGDVSPSDGGIPTPYSVANFSTTGSSSYAANPFGGYTINFDANGSPLVIGLTYAAVQGNISSDFGPFNFATGAVTVIGPASSQTYYANIEDEVNCG